MLWKKLGLVYGPNGAQDWAVSHAMLPTPFRLSEEVIRVFVTFCDCAGRGRPGYVDVSAKDPLKVLGVSKYPLFELGDHGAFDDNGIAICSVARINKNLVYMYYVGFELGVNIRYRLLTGLAISEDGGKSFFKYSVTPVLERTPEELLFRCGPFCLYENNLFKLWYVAGSSWTVIDGKKVPKYDIRYSESNDGISWPKKGEIQISIQNQDEHGFGRPYILKRSDGGYSMFYSIRRRSLSAYRLGYAESIEGYTWERRDEVLNLNVTPNNFDSQAIMYAAPIQIGDRLYVFYNGNFFGKEGFAAAEMIAS